MVRMGLVVSPTNVSAFLTVIGLVIFDSKEMSL